MGTGVEVDFGVAAGGGVGDAVGVTVGSGGGVGIAVGACATSGAGGGVGSASPHAPPAVAATVRSTKMRFRLMLPNLAMTVPLEEGIILAFYFRVKPV